MKKIKMLIDRLLLTKIEKISPKTYRQFFEIYKKLYSPFINKIKYRDKYFFNIVGIETSTYCNRKCDYCPNKDNETPKYIIDDLIFKEAIKQLKKIKFNGILQYNLYNEPLFNNKLIDEVKYASNELKNAIHILVTNGDLLTIEKAKELIDAGIDKFVVTIHDKNPDKAYERLSKVKYILKDKMRLQTIYDLPIQNRGGAVDINKYQHKNLTVCPNILSLTIGINGDVLLCCNDYYKKHVMGNIMENNIVDIWKSYANLREELLDRNIVRLDICKKCLEIEDNKNGSSK